MLFSTQPPQGGLPEHLKRTFYSDGGELPAAGGYPPSRFSDSPVSDFEDGYSLYRDRLQETPVPSYQPEYRPEPPRAVTSSGPPRGWRSNSPPSRADCSPPARRRDPR